jgi:hypothetical protein
MKFTLFCASRGRPGLLVECFDSFFLQASDVTQMEFIIAIDFDDHDTGDVIDQYALDTGFNIVKLTCHRSIEPGNDYLNRAAQIARGDLLWVLNDECVVTSDNWQDVLSESVSYFLHTQNDEIAYIICDDGTHVSRNDVNHRRVRDSGCCFPILTKDAVKAMGCFFPTEIVGWGEDIALYSIFAGLAESRILDLSDHLKVDHRSCHNGTREKDEGFHRMNEISKKCLLTDGERQKYIGRLEAEIKRCRYQKEVLENAAGH